MTIDIAGAGPAGLAAAIVLARAGHEVQVFESRDRVGGRFHDDLQGIENWTTGIDVLEELAAEGLAIDCWRRAFHRSELCKGSGADKARRSLRSDKPMYYLVRRGPQHPDSLDNALLRQAREAGVVVHFRRRIEAEKAHVFAGGPSGRPMAVVCGITFRTSLSDRASTTLCPELAPKGYVYFLCCEGHATLGVVLLDLFGDAKARLRRACRVVESDHGFRVPGDAVFWGGQANFAIPQSCMNGRAMLVGEAAGFQDVLFGFGIRSALLSGVMAARAITKGEDYEVAWRVRLLSTMRASCVNRACFETFPSAGALLCGALAMAPDARRTLRLLYGETWLHRLAGPWSERHFRDRGKTTVASKRGIC